MSETLIYVLIGAAVLFCGVLFWVGRLAGRAQAAEDQERQNRVVVDAMQRQSELNQVQAETAPTDADLDRILSEGKF